MSVCYTTTTWYISLLIIFYIIRQYSAISPYEKEEKNVVTEEEHSFVLSNPTNSNYTVNGGASTVIRTFQNT